MPRVGAYELWAPLGTGTTGAVWKAYSRGAPSRIVAVKRLRAPRAHGRSGRERLRREAAVLAGLDHPHVVRLLDVVADGGGVAIVMELAPGGSLEALLAERGQLTAGEVVAVAAPVADALAAAHRRGIVHGDVKAANVLFGPGARPLLADFDVARSARCTASEEIVGTAEYLAPEVLAGAPPDRRSDVYALGVVCFEALTGYVPFAAATPGRAAPLPDLGPLAAAVETATARDPRRRFASAEALSEALRAAVPPEDVRLPQITGAGTPAAVAWPGAQPARPTATFGPRPPVRDGPRARWWARAAAGGAVAAAVWALLSRALGGG